MGSAEFTARKAVTALPMVPLAENDRIFSQIIALEFGKTVDLVEFIGVFLSTARGGCSEKQPPPEQKKKSESMAQRRLETRDENNKTIKSGL